ncbi:glycoside hydrolase [Bimuria novae-zelandiae CBS 107.79]|uniref:beta-glucosidase n=1 Tax=Bimuria novae-zelandiae CBS 107.79 TaxID=1447943 RepID=A0A6A5VMH6_9PLEO|nr:glycoside hydrolase [Bimuria novae-zelandiae CBS 107.79]
MCPPKIKTVVVVSIKKRKESQIFGSQKHHATLCEMSWALGRRKNYSEDRRNQQTEQTSAIARQDIQILACHANKAWDDILHNNLIRRTTSDSPYTTSPSTDAGDIDAKLKREQNLSEERMDTALEEVKEREKQAEMELMERIRAAQLSNSQKVTIITARDVASNSCFASNITWSAYTSKDAFAGMNNQYFVLGFPSGNALSMTWDLDLVHAEAKVAGDEFYGMDYALISGPEAGLLGRTPWGGRQAEAMSPDPYLSGLILGQAITDMNSAGVIAGGRHFLLNEQETNRTAGLGGSTTIPYSSNADDKTVHELYL